MTHQPLRALVTLVALGVLASCRPPYVSPTQIVVKPPSSSSAGMTVVEPVVLAPLIDARPASLRATHHPVEAKGYGFAIVYFAFGGDRKDGPSMPGDAGTTFSLGGAGAVDAVYGLEEYVAAVIQNAMKKPIERARRPLAVSHLATASSLIPGGTGYVLVPILDQLDEFSLSSEDTISGGASYRSGYSEVTTTAGYSSGSAYSGRYANLRMRLVMMEFRGGKQLRQHVAYMAASHEDMSKNVLGVGAVLAIKLVMFIANATPTAAAP